MRRRRCPRSSSARRSRAFFPNENAVGHRLRNGKDEAEIVGIVGDIRRAALTDRKANADRPPAQKIDMTEVRGSGGLFTTFSSHTYWTEPLSKVKPFFQHVHDIFKR